MPPAPSSALRRAGLVVPILMLVALTGCKGKSTAAAAPTPVHSIAQPPASAGSTTGPSTGAGTGAASGAPTKTCPSGDTPGVIGGASKCLRVGQLCSAKHTADYPAYGFTCDLTGNRYVLHRKA